MGARTRVPLLAVGAVGATAVAGYVAERRTVARWMTGDDRLRSEPRTVGGTERRVASADGAALHAVDIEPDDGLRAGSTPTVVLAHGYTATIDHWAPVAARLGRAGCRVVAFDQRGHGRSEAGGGRFGAERLADDLAAIVQAMDDGHGVIVAGHSMGGIGAQAMLHHRPEARRHVRGLVLVATLARPVPVPLSRLMGRLGGTALARTTMAHRVHGRVLARGGLGDEPLLTALDVVRHGWASCPDTTRAGVTRDLRHYDFSDTLRALDVPTAILCGTLDRVTPMAESERMAGLVPGARFVAVPGCGHALPWEAADVVADAILDQALDRSDDQPNPQGDLP